MQNPIAKLLKKFEEISIEQDVGQVCCSGRKNCHYVKV